jgi:Cdc6-like AAA superfamily ATPase
MLTSDTSDRDYVYIEVCINDKSSTRYDTIINILDEYLRNHYEYLKVDTVVEFKNSFLEKNVDWIKVCEAKKKITRFKDAKVEYFPFQFQDDVQSNETTLIHDLPCKEWNGLWESLVFDQDLPLELLNFIQTGLYFSDLNVNNTIINVNKLILLFGPPGTGKTSLCKALAQKSAIRNSHRFSFSKLVEINAHSLFSKYFSESGKLIQKLFSQIQKIVDDDDTFVVILMDEVESLTASRKSVISGLEPSDALRVVNALLTQIDKYRSKKNVLILATSNLVDAIDSAFLDRVDIKKYVGNPSEEGIYKILSSGILELVEKGLIIQPQKPILKWDELQVDSPSFEDSILLNISKEALGMSGRTLRKLAFLAHARYIQHVYFFKLT